MKKAVFGAAIVITLSVILALQFGETTTSSDHQTQLSHSVIAEDSNLVQSYFIDTITKKCREYHRYDSLGLGGGVDGFLLMKVFPGLAHSDFQQVTALMGDYSLIKGVMHFTGNAASNSAVINENGFKILLKNISMRLHINVSNRDAIDSIVSMISS